MSRFNWACPTCGAATHSEGILVRTSERACSCDSPLWVASDMPRCVVKLQEEISALRAAAIQPVMSRQGFGTPGIIEFYRCVFCNHDARTPDIDHDSDCVVREAGYFGGVE